MRILGVAFAIGTVLAGASAWASSQSGEVSAQRPALVVAEVVSRVHDRMAGKSEDALNREALRKRLRAGWQLGSPLRVVLDEARSMPSAGGRLLSRQVGMFCHDVGLVHRQGSAATRTDVNHVNYGLVLAASRELQIMCDSVALNERFPVVLRERDFHVDSLMSEDDPYLIAYVLLASAQSKKDLRLATELALLYFDPGFIGLLFKPVKNALWFDGQWYVDEQSNHRHRVLSDAISLVSCRIDVSCDRMDPFLAMDCVVNADRCGLRTRRQMIRTDQLKDGLPVEAFEETERVALKVFQAIRERRVEAFLAP